MSPQRSHAESKRTYGTSRGLGAAAMAAILVGSAGTAATLGAESLHPLAIGSWRTVVGGAGLLLLAGMVGQSPWRYRSKAGWIWVGVLAVPVNQLAFFGALERTGVALGTLVTIGSIPVAAGAIQWVRSRETPSPQWVLGILMALSGIALLSTGAVQASPTGLLLAVLSGAAFGVIGLSLQELMVDRPTLPAVSAVMGGAALLLLPVAAASSGAVLGSAITTITMLYLGLGTLTIAYVLLGTALRTLNLRAVAAVALLEPAVAATLAVVVLDEPFGPQILAGTALVIGGVAMASVLNRE